MVELLEGEGGFEAVIGLARTGAARLELTDETSIAQAAGQIANRNRPLRLVLDTTGFLHDDEFKPEKSLSQLDPRHLAHSFAINAIGPALLMKHFLPLLAREGKAVFATLSARVGSIGDNRLGGWHGYRASKAALNQLVRTAAVELRRSHRQAVCIALHPGTVDTRLSRPFAKDGLDVRSPTTAASEIWTVLQALGPDDSGSFLDQHGRAVPW
jgi:NAD(P)-dependent dehydrogenase (short-subunit alcohol dehydrogenase family)